MRNLISGIVGICFGSFILLGFVLRGGPRGAGGYLVGQYIALGMGALFVVGGVYYIVKGFNELRPPAPPRRRRKRQSTDRE